MFWQGLSVMFCIYCYKANMNRKSSIKLAYHYGMPYQATSSSAAELTRGSVLSSKGFVCFTLSPRYLLHFKVTLKGNQPLCFLVCMPWGGGT